MDVLALRLPLADGGDFLVHDVVGRQRIVRDEQDEDVAIAKLALDLRAPIAPPGIRRSVQMSTAPCFSAGLRNPVTNDKPLNLAVARLLRLVQVGVADKDDRLRFNRHGAPHP